MCKWIKSGNQRIDPCMRDFINQLTIGGAKVLACCCGHGKYSTTVVFQRKQGVFVVAYCSKSDSVAKILPRKKRFYRRDKDGWFFIPEIEVACKLASEASH